MRSGDIVKVRARGREHTNKVGTIQSECTISGHVDVLFDGNQRAWTEWGESYTVPYTLDELELVKEATSDAG